MFGRFCPFPLRFTTDAQTGVSAAQYMRLAADVLAMRRTRPVARLTFTQSATPTVDSYTGVNGSGIACAPTLTRVGTGVTTVAFPAYYLDRLGNAKPISLMAAQWGICSTFPRIVRVAVTGNNVATVTVTSLAGAAVDAKISITFEGCWENTPTLDDYGCSDEKEDVTEELVPYAWTWYQELEGMLGSAFTAARTGYVHAQKLALARLLGAGIQRGLERLACNLNPTTADDMLDVWATVFSVQHGPSTPRWEIRQDCAARMLLLTGITPTAVDAAVGKILGNLLIEVHRNTSEPLSAPPDATYWPGGDPGDPTLGLCGYQWSSARANIWAEVTLPTSMLDTEFHRLTDVRLLRLFDLALPAHATAGWAPGSGFLLDSSLMDYDAL